MEELAKYSTRELHEELAKRAGVEEITVNLENVALIADHNEVVKRVDGPARILVNKD